VTYGLGTENQNLPGFITMCPGGYPLLESQNWQAGFLPGVYQGTYIDTKHTSVEKLIEHIYNDTTTAKEQKKQLDLLAKLNAKHQAERAGDPQLEARIRSFELAYRMQSEAAEAFDVTREPKKVLDAYGPGEQARSLLLARRLVERGVRFVQVYSGAGSKWDAHSDLEGNHTRMCGQVDQPSAALIKDLKQRGLLEDTLVVWGGEFGRTPMTEGTNGRDHDPYGFSMLLAGAGVKGGTIHGTTDEFGLRGIDGRAHVHDFHATILHLLGIDHERLAVRHQGLDVRLTGVEKARVVKDILA
jgi:uncharacterized protein (DUF1501 family)